MVVPDRAIPEPRQDSVRPKQPHRALASTGDVLSRGEFYPWRHYHPPVLFLYLTGRRKKISPASAQYRVAKAPGSVVMSADPLITPPSGAPCR